MKEMDSGGLKTPGCRHPGYVIGANQASLKVVPFPGLKGLPGGYRGFIMGIPALVYNEMWISILCVGTAD
jgi:hypothetical protein